MTDPASYTERSESHQGCRDLREESRRQGVTDPDNLPFLLCPADASVAALLVHGFTATPWEMRLLAEGLAEAGIASLAVRLPGHGTSPEDLAARRWQEWQAAVKDGYAILAQDFPAIYGMGMSTGCLLLLSTATELSYNGMVLFSPYLRILHRLAPLAGFLRWVKPYHVKPAEPTLTNRYYQKRPLAGIHQINRLIGRLRPHLEEISTPVLAFNGKGDETVDISSSQELMQSLGSQVKIHAVFGSEVPHVLTREENPCHRSMFMQAVDFVQELENPGKPAEVR